MLRPRVAHQPSITAAGAPVATAAHHRMCMHHRRRRPHRVWPPVAHHQNISRASSNISRSSSAGHQQNISRASAERQQNVSRTSSEHQQRHGRCRPWGGSAGTRRASESRSEAPKQVRRPQGTRWHSLPPSAMHRAAHRLGQGGWCRPRGALWHSLPTSATPSQAAPPPPRHTARRPAAQPARGRLWLATQLRRRPYRCTLPTPWRRSQSCRDRDALATSKARVRIHGQIHAHALSPCTQ